MNSNESAILSEEDQIKITKEIMRKIFSAITSVLQKNEDKMSIKCSVQIMYSCLVMTVREMLVDMILSSGDALAIMPSIIDSFKSTIETVIKEAVMENVTDKKTLH